MLVGVQFLRDGENDDRVTTTIIQDGPERKPSGDFAYLAQHEVLELLNQPWPKLTTITKPSGTDFAEAAKSATATVRAK